MYICVKSLFFRLKDEERIRGGLYFVQGIPRDENWKASENIIFFKKTNLCCKIMWEKECISNFLYF